MLKIIFIFALLLNSATAGSFKETIINFIKANVSQKISAPDFDIQLENWTDAWDKENISESDLVLKDLQVTQDQRRFTIQVDGVMGSIKKFMGKIEWLAEVATLNRPIGPGEIVQETDIIMQKVNADRLNANQIKDKRDLIGKTAKNTMLKAGVPLNKSELQSPIAIKKGALTIINYQKGNLRITTQAIAEKDGCIGDTISFETLSASKEPNTAQKRIIHAQVIGVNSAMIGDQNAA